MIKLEIFFLSLSLDSFWQHLESEFGTSNKKNLIELCSHAAQKIDKLISVVLRGNIGSTIINTKLESFSINVFFFSKCQLPKSHEFSRSAENFLSVSKQGIPFFSGKTSSDNKYWCKSRTHNQLIDMCGGQAKKKIWNSNFSFFECCFFLWLVAKHY